MAGLFVLWLALAGAGPADLLPGAAAAFAAAWVSLRLRPPGDWQFRPLALAGFALRFLRQSVTAGVDVAWRAFDPRLPLRPGFVICPLRLPPGPTRNLFCTITSLLPGTVPAGSAAGGGLIVHCLDTAQPVAADLRAEEALLTKVLLGHTQGSSGNG